jgi:hypothetical protein
MFSNVMFAFDIMMHVLLCLAALHFFLMIKPLLSETQIDNQDTCQIRPWPGITSSLSLIRFSHAAWARALQDRTHQNQKYILGKNNC